MRNNIEKHVGNSNVTDNPIELFDYCKGFTETPIHRREVNTKQERWEKRLWKKDRRRDGCGGDAIFFVFLIFGKKDEWDEKSFYNNEK